MSDGTAKMLLLKGAASESLSRQFHCYSIDTKYDSIIIFTFILSINNGNTV